MRQRIPGQVAAGVVCGTCGEVTDEAGGCSCVGASYWAYPSSVLMAGFSAADKVIRVDNVADWPAEDFVVTVDKGQAHEEWIRIESRDGRALAVAERGVGPTIACPHAAGASVTPN